MEAMHDFWCDSERAATPLCVEIAQRRAALEAGTQLAVHKSNRRLAARLPKHNAIDAKAP